LAGRGSPGGDRGDRFDRTERSMPLTAEQKDVLKLMRSAVKNYQTLSIGSAHGLRRLARDYFKTDIDIEPTIRAIWSRRGDKIYNELMRLQAVIDDLEKRPGQ